MKGKHEDKRTQTLLERYGKDYFSKIAKKGHKPGRRYPFSDPEFAKSARSKVQSRNSSDVSKAKPKKV